MFVCPHIFKLLFLSVFTAPLFMCGSRGRERGPGPWKITGYMGLYRNKHLEEAGPENVGPLWILGKVKFSLK